MGWFSKKQSDDEVLVDRAFRKMRASETTAKAQSLLTLGRAREAVQVLRDTMKLAPEYLPAVGVLAEALRVTGDIRGAKRVIEDALKKDHGDQLVPVVDWNLTLGTLALTEGNTRAALELYEKALAAPRPQELSPQEWEKMRSRAWARLADLRYQEGQFEEARACVRRRLAVMPDCPIAGRLLGLIVAKLYNNQLAEELQAQRANPGVDLPADVIEALSCLERAIAKQPTDYECVAMAGVLSHHLCNTTHYRSRPDEVETLRERAVVHGTRLATDAAGSAPAAEALKMYCTGFECAGEVGFLQQGIRAEVHVTVTPNGHNVEVAQIRD